MQIPKAVPLGLVLVVLLITGCATTKYTPMNAGVIPLVQMRVIVGDGWLRVPRGETPEELSSSRTLSRENLELDRLMLIPSVRNGQSIFRSQGGATSLPAFGADMNPEQIANLVAQSMQKTLWNGGATVSAKNAEEHGFLGTPGFLFDLDVDMPDGPDHQGFAGGFVHEDRLYVNIFTAESPDHFNQEMDAARQVIDRVTLALPTIRMNAVPRADDLLRVAALR